MATLNKRRNWVLFTVAIAALGIGGIFRGRTWRPFEASASAAQKFNSSAKSQSRPLALADFKNGFASVIDPDLPAVVKISTVKMVTSQGDAPQASSPQFSPGSIEAQFRRSPASGAHPERSLGSGVIVSADGYIVTNNHVVSNAMDVEVFSKDGRDFKAKVIGEDAQTDVAVLKIDASKLPFLAMGDSSRLNVGDIVFAIGDSFGIGETATTGIVSATGRGLNGVIEHYEDFIQTDAAINPGNSGGALIDLRGNLVGINTALLSDSGGGNQGVGFAIPINLARRIMDQIVDHGKVIRGYLGVTFQPVDAEMARAFGLDQGGGALVDDLTPGSPAAKAGIESGDIIVELDGEKVSAPNDLSLRIAEMAPARVVQLKVFRSGKERQIEATLGEYAETAKAASVPLPEGAPLEGVDVRNLTSDLATHLGVSSPDGGVLVVGVDQSSAAAVSGLQAGDVIEEVNHTSVQDTSAYQRALTRTGNQALVLRLRRNGKTHFMLIHSE